ncbi:hypothetical protein [Viridibacillus arvi]
MNVYGRCSTFRRLIVVEFRKVGYTLTCTSMIACMSNYELSGAMED